LEVVSGVDYIKEVLVWCMAVTAPVPMQTEAFVPLSITYDSKTFVQQDDIWAIQADDADRLALVNKTLPDRDAVYGYLCQIRLLERDLCRALKDANAVEYQPLNKTIFSNNKWNEENFNLLRLETNKFIGELSRFVEKVTVLEALDFIEFNNHTFVRRVFDYSWSETRGADGCLLVWQHAIQERDDLVQAHNFAVLQHNKLLDATEVLAGAGSPTHTAVTRKAEQKKSQMQANCINKEWFQSNKIAAGMVFFRALIDERDELYSTLWDLCTFIVMSDAKSTITLGQKPKIRNAAMFGAAASSAVHTITGRTRPTFHAADGAFEITADDGGGVTADDRVTAPVNVDTMSEKALREMVRAQEDMIRKQSERIKKQQFWKQDIATLFDDRTKQDFNLGLAIRELSMFEYRVRNKLYGFPDEPLFKELKRLKKCDQQNRDLLEFVSTMQKIVDPNGHPDSDAIVTETKAKFNFSRLVCSALSCTEDTFQKELGVLQQKEKMLESEVALALAPIETEVKTSTFMDRVRLLSSIMQKIKIEVPCRFIDHAPDLIQKLKGDANQTHKPFAVTDDVAKLKEDLDMSNDDLQKLQVVLLDARQNYIHEHDQVSAGIVKIRQLEVVLQATEQKLQDVTYELHLINATDVNPLVITSRTAYLLGELHKLIDENFARISDVDIVILVDRIADVICSAFKGIHRFESVKLLMYVLVVRLQLDFKSGDVDEGVAVARFLIKQWKEHGDEIADNPLKFAQKMDEEIKKMTGVSAAWRKRFDDMFQKVVEAKSKDSKPPGNPAGESESQAQGRGQHEGESQVHPRGASGSGRTTIPVANAHIECVNNWLRDLSQIV
jgi:hypothetical protein